MSHATGYTIENKIINLLKRLTNKVYYIDHIIAPLNFIYDINQI